MDNISTLIQKDHFRMKLKEELGEVRHRVKYENKLKAAEKRIREFWKSHPKVDNGGEF